LQRDLTLQRPFVCGLRFAGGLCLNIGSLLGATGGDQTAAYRCHATNDRCCYC
jgi:hypothetical protein